jgi:hypothetical protein
VLATGILTSSDTQVASSRKQSGDDGQCVVLRVLVEAWLG